MCVMAGAQPCWHFLLGKENKYLKGFHLLQKLKHLLVSLSAFLAVFSIHHQQLQSGSILFPQVNKQKVISWESSPIYLSVKLLGTELSYGILLHHP